SSPHICALHSFPTRRSSDLLDTSLQQAGLGFIYTVYAGLELVAQLLGGIIPTDIQGIYRSGVPTVSTAVNGPYYHTTEDTPDKVDRKSTRLNSSHVAISYAV